MAFRDPAPIKMTEVKEEVVRLDDDKQDKNSSNLTTDSKNIEGAINELKTKSDTLTSNSALKSTQIIAGDGLQGGGTLEQNITLSTKVADDSLTASSSGLAVNTYDGVDSTSTTRPASANALKITYDKLVVTENTANSKLSKAGDTMSGDISFSNQGTSFVGLKGSVGDNDGWRIVGGSSYGNLGELEIATGFDGTQPIYVRQYNVDEYAGVARTLTLLDNNGNTSFPGIVTASKFEGSSLTSDKLSNPVNINDTEFDGSESITTNKWGVSRVLTIGDFTTHIDGSSDITVEKELIGLPTKEEYDLKLDSGGYEGTANDLKNLIDSKPNTEVVAGQGLESSQIGNTVTVSIESADEGILVNENNIQLNVVNDLVTGGIKRPLSAEQGKVLKQLIDTLGGGGTTSLLRQARILGDADYIGSISASAVDIVVGSKLNKPTLYLDGTRMDSTTYSVELNLGKITLNEAYADYDVTWVVEDEFPSHIRFSYPTLSLLQADEQIKSIINVGDVIEILGESDADDGGQRLVKCSNELGLNGVDIGDGKYLNEIPNSKPSDKVDKSDIVDNLTTADKSKVLSANMGAILYGNTSGWRIYDGDKYPYTHDVLEIANSLPDKSVYFGQTPTVVTGTPIDSLGSVVFIYRYNRNRIVYMVCSVDGRGDEYYASGRTSDITVKWTQILRDNSLVFLGTQGVSSIIYIQDEGKKTAGNGYVDKTTGKLYLCKTTTTDTSVTTNFVLATNIENASRLDNLCEVTDLQLSQFVGSNQLYFGKQYKYSDGRLEYKFTVQTTASNKEITFNFPTSFTSGFFNISSTLTSIQGNLQNGVAKIKTMSQSYITMLDTGTSSSSISISGTISGFWK